MRSIDKEILYDKHINQLRFLGLIPITFRVIKSILIGLTAIAGLPLT